MQATAFITLPPAVFNFILRERKSDSLLVETMARGVIRWVVENYSPEEFHCELHETHLEHKEASLSKEEVRSMEKERCHFLSKALEREVTDEQATLVNIKKGLYRNAKNMETFLACLTRNLHSPRREEYLNEPMREKAMNYIQTVANLNEVLSLVNWKQWGSPWTYESGHTLMDCLNGQSCHGKAFSKALISHCAISIQNNLTIKFKNACEAGKKFLALSETDRVGQGWALRVGMLIQAWKVGVYRITSILLRLREQMPVVNVSTPKPLKSSGGSAARTSGASTKEKGGWSKVKIPSPQRLDITNKDTRSYSNTFTGFVSSSSDSDSDGSVASADSVSSTTTTSSDDTLEKKQSKRAKKARKKSKKARAKKVQSEKTWVRVSMRDRDAILRWETDSNGDTEIEYKTGHMFTGVLTKDNLRPQNGRYTYFSREGEMITYEGDFKHGMFHTTPGRDAELVFHDSAKKKCDMIYVGQFKSGRYHGHGHVTCTDGSYTYIGMYKHHQKCGKGMLIYTRKEKKTVYTGQFERNKYHGRGVLTTAASGRPTVKFTGTFKDGEMTHGDYSSSTGIVYSGGFRNGYKNGQGVIRIPDDMHVVAVSGLPNDTKRKPTYSQNFRLEGTFKNDVLTGHGYVNLPEFHYTGEFMNNKPEGEGVMVFKKGANAGKRHEGKFRQGDMYHGKIIWLGDEYEGDVLPNGDPTGVGTYRFANGDVYVGEISNDDTAYGTGTYTWASGEVYTGKIPLDGIHALKSMLHKK